MFDIGWSELLVIGAIALIVVGPKDLPGMLRTLGRYTAKARGMARDFQRSMEDAAREADIADMKELRDTAKGLRDLKNMRLDDIAPEPKRTSASAPRPPAPAPKAPAEASAPAAPEG